MGHPSVSCRSMSIHFLNCYDTIGLPLLNNALVDLFLCLSFFSVRKRRGGNKQTDCSAAGARDPSRPVKTGSPQFVRELRSRTFPK